MYFNKRRCIYNLQQESSLVMQIYIKVAVIRPSIESELGCQLSCISIAVVENYVTIVSNNNYLL